MSAVPLEDEREPLEVWEWALGILVVAVCAAWVAYRLHVIEIRFDGIIPHVNSLVFRDTVANGGDMGAHVYWPWFLEHNWFLKGRLAGWSPSWYSGFPIGQYYFPFPAVLTSLFDLILPYNVAFKIVTVLGPVSLPIGAYFLADELEFPWPAAPLTSVATLYYQFELRRFGGDTTWTIYGGNLASGLAGEYSFTLSLSLSLFFLAAFAHTLKTGKRSWLPTVLFACCVTSHVVVALAASFLAVLVFVHFRPARTWRIAVPIGVIGTLLTMVWTIPLLATEPFTSSMRYEKVTEYVPWLFGPGKHFTLFGLLPLPKPLWLWGLILAAVLGGGFWLRKSTLILVIWAASFGVAFRYWPRDVAVWNTRFIPFYFLALAFLAALGATELLRGLAYFLRWIGDWQAEGARRDWAIAWRAHRPVVAPAEAEPSSWVPADWNHAGWNQMAPVGGRVEGPTGNLTGRLAVEDDLAFLDSGHPGRELRRRRKILMATPLAVGLVALAVLGVYNGDNNGKGTVSYWAYWNYSGYEAKAAYPEFKNIMDQMNAIGHSKQHGCGRALWEPSSGKVENIDDPLNQYGTSLALELLPFYTNNCIGSMEGLYFESSATKDAHFMTVSELGAHPSNPVRGIDWGSTSDFAFGIEHARMLGVRYLMFWAPESQTLARSHGDDLQLIATIKKDVDKLPPHEWQVYEIKNWALAVGLSVEPVVVNASDGTDQTCWPGRGAVSRSTQLVKLNAWECVTDPQWMDSAALAQPIAETGPASWRRVTVKPRKLVADKTTLPSATGGVSSSDLVPSGPSVLDPILKTPQRKIVPAVVTNIVESIDSLRFHVDQIGKPVVVRTSYFPNWEVSGATGPYRIGPNLMVVIPTSHDVALNYGVTGPDWLGRLATLFGAVALALMVWKFRSFPLAWTSTASGDTRAAPKPAAPKPVALSDTSAVSSVAGLDPESTPSADPVPPPPPPLLDRDDGIAEPPLAGRPPETEPPALR